MPLITRQFGPNAKGSKLTIQEVDDNLLYLESLGVDAFQGVSVDNTSIYPNSTVFASFSQVVGSTVGLPAAPQLDEYKLSAFLEMDETNEDFYFVDLGSILLDTGTSLPIVTVGEGAFTFVYGNSVFGEYATYSYSLGAQVDNSTPYSSGTYTIVDAEVIALPLSPTEVRILAIFFTQPSSSQFFKATVKLDIKILSSETLTWSAI
jgi:hypothetical protein